MPQSRSAIEAHFYGVFRDEDKKLITKMKLDDRVTVHGYLPHRECTRALQRSDLLWMVIGNGQDADMISTGKLYDYLGSHRPILACIPEGVAMQTLAPSGAAFFCPPDDPAAIAEQLEKLYGLWKKHQLPTVSDEYASQFDRAKLTEQLARYFGSTLEVNDTVNIIGRKPG